MRTLRLAVFCFPLIGIAGCSSAPATLREPDEYQGCATDESWRTFDDRELGKLVTTDDAQAPALSGLATGMMLLAGVSWEFDWNLSATMAGKPLGDASCAACPTCGALVAQHLPPVSGDVYDFQLSSGDQVIWRALTTLQTYKLPDTEWAALKGKTLSLHLVRMLVKVNDVQGGPFQATQPTPFTISNN